MDRGSIEAAQAMGGQRLSAFRHDRHGDDDCVAGHDRDGGAVRRRPLCAATYAARVMIGVQNNFCGKNRREYDGSCASALALVMRLLKRAPHSSRLVRREPRGRASLTHFRSSNFVTWTSQSEPRRPDALRMREASAAPVVRDLADLLDALRASAAQRDLEGGGAAQEKQWIADTELLTRSEAG